MPGACLLPTDDNLSDDAVVGKVYDNRVVMRLLTYIVPYKKDALISLAAMLVYTAANVGIPLVVMFGINWGINSGEVWRLHVAGPGLFRRHACALRGQLPPARLHCQSRAGGPV